MSFLDTINRDLTTALKNKNEAGIRALRAVKAAILLALTEKGASKEMDDATGLKLIQKQIKQRTESRSIYLEQGRDDLAQTEQEEIEVLEKYLPEQLSREEMEAVVSKIISETGAAGMKDMGRVMGLASKETAGKADGKTLSEIARNLLNNS